MASPRVLLLGGHGKVALHLTPLLLNRGWDVVSVVRNAEHEKPILRFNDNAAAERRGEVSVLVSSLDEVRQISDAQRVVESARPDYVVWAAGAGGKGDPSRTYGVDQDAAKHFMRASLTNLNITKFLMVSHIGSRRNRAPWWSDDDWASAQGVQSSLPHYYKAKLEADEYLTAFAERRRQFEADASGDKSVKAAFQDIVLRPGLLTEDPASGKVALGHTPGGGQVSRENVARAAVALLAREDTRGYLDLLDGDTPLDKAVEDVAGGKGNALEGEDVDTIRKRFKEELDSVQFQT